MHGPQHLGVVSLIWMVLGTLIWVGLDTLIWVASAPGSRGPDMEGPRHPNMDGPRHLKVVASASESVSDGDPAAVLIDAAQPLGGVVYDGLPLVPERLATVVEFGEALHLPNSEWRCTCSTTWTLGSGSPEGTIAAHLVAQRWIVGWCQGKGMGFE